MDWIENGPVSAPPRSVAVGAAGVIFVAAALGLGIGLHAAWREADRRSLGDIDQTDIAQAVTARPIVEIPAAPPPPAANEAASNAAAEAKDDDDDNDIAAKTAAVQSIQAEPAKPQADIDQILASPSEKPQAPVKPSQDEDSSAKSDVPF